MPNDNEIHHRLRNLLAKLVMRVEVARLRSEDDEALSALEMVEDCAREMAAGLTELESAAETAAGLSSTVTDGAPDETRGPFSPPASPGTTHPTVTGRPSDDDHASAFDQTLPSAGLLSSSNEPPLREGVVIGGAYGIIRTLGSGGMGTVMLARDLQLGRLVAVKLVVGARFSGAQAVQAFSSEARAMARVSHPNVVTIFAFGEHEGTPYFAMEYVPGTSLERMLSMRESALPFDRAVNVVDQMCQGLEAIHRAGTLHCDVKPANVLVGPSFRVAVADLGLARAFADGPGLTGGTPGFVAPEVIEDPRGPATERVDVYAVAAVTYELFTGRPPFRADTVKDTLQHQLDGHFVPPSELAELPPAMDDIIGRALSVDASRRQPSVEAFRRAVLEVSASVERSYADLEVMVVDDDAELVGHHLDLVRRALPDATVTAHTDPREALKRAESRPPDVAVVDLDMPNVNGIELTAALKAAPKGRDIQVVMLTGVGSARDWDVLRQLGAAGFLIKPVDEDELRSMLRHLSASDAEAPSSESP